MRAGAPPARSRQASAFRMVTLDAPLRAESMDSMLEMPNKVANRMFNKAKFKMPLNGIEPVGEGDAATDPEILPIIEYEEPLFTYTEQG